MSDRHTREADMKTNIVRLLAENAELKRERDEAREQRDRLADALERIADYQGRYMEEYPTSIAAEALQSLNQPINTI